MALFASARRLAPEIEMLDSKTAFELLSTHVQKDGSVLRNPCPLILSLETGEFLRPEEIHIGTRFQPRSQMLPQPTQRRSFDVSLGTLLFHGEKQPIPLEPRLEYHALFKRIRKQLWEIDRHPLADNVDYEAPLPSRVLDLANPKSGKRKYWDDDLSLKLGTGQRDEYACLSYRWGGYRGFLTQQATFRDRRRGIRFKDLPKLFQDAVVVTRRLGIRYLWIDALCIIQDNKDDWEWESLQMASIYRNCKVRIAATAAKNPTKSFYPPKPIVASVRVMQLESTENDTSDFALSPLGRSSDEWSNTSQSDTTESSSLGRCKDMRADERSLLVETGSVKHHRPEKRFVTLPRDYGDDVDESGLNRRAWVLQERLLAPATVHFCEDHIYVEGYNSDNVIGEDGIVGFHFLSCIQKAGLGRSMLMKHDDIGENSMNHSHSPLDAYRDSWLRIAEIYSTCKTTYATDKLIAIAGLAGDRRALGGHPYLDSRYFLGMWESTLHEDLLWIPLDPQAFHFLDSLHLPSWAWMAYEGPITFIKDRRSRWTRGGSMIGKAAMVAAFKLLRLTGPYESARLPFNMSVSMSISLKLSQIPCLGPKISKLLDPCNYSHEEAYHNSPFQYDLGDGTRKPIALAAFNHCLELRDEHNEAFGYLSMDNTDIPPPAELWCAHIATLEHDQGTPILAYCLIVVPTADKGNEYRRVGVAEVKFEWIYHAPMVTIELA